MRTTDQKNRMGEVAPDWSNDVSARTLQCGQALSNQVYRELDDQPVGERDLMSDLECNLQTLEELQGRLSFLMREVRYLMKA